MNKLKRIISLAFIIAFALSQFEYIKAESVEADMTDAKNAETVVASEEEVKEEVKAEAKEEVKAETVATCKTHEQALEELTKAMEEKMSRLNMETEDYIVKVVRSKDPKDNQDPSEYQENYQLSFTILNEEKSFSEIDMTNLAELINDLYKEEKIDRIKFTTFENEGTNLKDKLANLNDEQRKVELNALIKDRLEKSMLLGEGRKLGTIDGKDGYMRLSKKACGNKEAFLWLRIPFRNAIVNKIKDKIEAKDITVNKNADVNWKDGVKVKDAYKAKKGYKEYIDNATVTDGSKRDTKTAGEKLGKIKLKFTDDTELTLDNQKLIVKEDKKAEENNNTKPNNKEKEEMPERKDKDNNRYDRYDRNDRYDRYNKDKKNESNDKNTKESKNDKVAKETKTEEKVEKTETKTEAKQDNGVLAPAQALRLVQHTDLPEGEKGEATRELLARGVLNGVSDTEFKGKLAINRAMLAQVLMTISKDKSTGLIDYVDIKGDEWYADAMTWALTHGIYKGYPDKTVKATQKITRQEFASVIYNFIKEHKINMPKVKDFNYKDQYKIASWALDAVKHLDEIGLVSGENMDNYNAQGTYTREDLALTIYKIIKFIESK